MRMEQGYTVLEVTVALALFVSVLVPAIGGALHVMTRGSVRPAVEALAQGQRILEETLRHRRFQDRTWMSEDGRWAFRRTVRRQGKQVRLTVRVWRARGPARLEAATKKKPLLRLATTRLADQNSQ
jgi:type II secretory pathway component PulJ